MLKFSQTNFGPLTSLETGDYYFKFLEGFEKQRIKVKHLCKLSDKQFEAYGITTIGNIETIPAEADLPDQA